MKSKWVVNSKKQVRNTALRNFENVTKLLVQINALKALSN